MWHNPAREPDYSQRLDWIQLRSGRRLLDQNARKTGFPCALPHSISALLSGQTHAEAGKVGLDAALAGTFPASDPGAPILRRQAAAPNRSANAATDGQAAARDQIRDALRQVIDAELG
jgi:hypothetical protein